MTDKMDKTAEEIFQELQHHIIFLRDKVKQAELKHLDNVMSCGHGQYPKHLEIRNTATSYRESIVEYSVYKKLLDILIKQKNSNNHAQELNNIQCEIESLTTKISELGYSKVYSSLKNWLIKLQTTINHFK
jgi:hypothetical protein